MATDLLATFTRTPTLTLAISNNATNRGGYYSVDYTGLPNTYVEVEATTRFGVAVVWSMPGVPISVQGAVHGGDTHKFRIPLNHAGNVLAPGTNITVQAVADGLTRQVAIRVLPTIASFAPLPDTYVRPTGNPSLFYSFDLRPVAVEPTASQLMVKLELRTNPLSNTAVSHVQWTSIEPNNGNQVYAPTIIDAALKGIRLDDAQRVRTSVAVPNSGQATRTIDLIRFAIPTEQDLGNGLKFALDRFEFAGARFAVTREDGAHLNDDYTDRWTRSDAFAAPQCYAAGTNLRLNNVTLRLLTPTAVGPTQVVVRATAYFRRHNHEPTAVTVATAAWAVPNAQAAGTHVMGNLNFGNLPTEVAHNNPLLVFWEVSSDNGVTWEPLTVSANTVYVTAAAPVAALRVALNDPFTTVAYLYDSLLAISCDAARGLPSPASVPLLNQPQARNDIRDAIAAAFVLGPLQANPRMVRLNRICGAPLQWAYWHRHREGIRPAQSVNGNRSILDGGNLFTTTTGAVACGVWADMLLAMWAMHGKGDGHRVEVLPRTPANVGLPYTNPPAAVPNAQNGSSFLVRRWSFNNPAHVNANNYTHAVANRLRGAPVANGAVDRAAAQTSGAYGQNNADPPPSFLNHFIVRDNLANLFFDPSYGTQGVTRDAWCDGAMAGLLSPGRVAGYVSQQMGDPDGIRANRLSVGLVDLDNANTWVP